MELSKGLVVLRGVVVQGGGLLSTAVIVQGGNFLRIVFPGVIFPGVIVLIRFNCYVLNFVNVSNENRLNENNIY